jgi:olefin beta-lactone synthetase
MVERAESGDALAGLCAGAPVPRIELRIIRPHDSAVELGSSGWREWEVERGGEGEIVVAGPHVLGEYFDSVEETRRHKIRDGETVWHRTGDGGRLDADGRLWLLGRISTRVRRNSRLWWSTPAELMALSVAGVRHAAFLGMPDERTGERTVLCVECDDLDEIRASIVAALAPIPVDELRSFRHIPRDPRHASKTDTEALRRLITGSAG